MARKQHKFPDILFHYTSHDAFLSIIESGEFWAHDYRLANDRREISYAHGLIRLSLEKISRGRFRPIVDDILSVFSHPFDPFELRTNDGYIAIASLSEEENQLSQWRAYAPDSGYSLGFDRMMLFTIASEQGFSVGKVIYDFEKQINYINRELRAFLEKEITYQDSNTVDPLSIIDRFDNFCSLIAPLVKHESFYEEREGRIFRRVLSNEISFHAGATSIRPYIPIKLASPGTKIRSLRAVRIGPCDDQHSLARWTRDLLEQKNYTIDALSKKELELKISGSPYRLIRR